MLLHNYFEYFDMVYFINLPIRTDRYDNIMNMFRILNITKYKKIVPITDDISSTKSCKSSHISCIDDAIENDYDKIFIFEDDVCFNQDNIEIEKKLDYHLDICFNFLMSNNWNLFYFDNMIQFRKENNIIKGIFRDKVHKGIEKIPGKLFTHSYAIHKESFKCIKDFASSDLNIDSILYIIKLDNKYMYCEGIFDQSLNITSDIN